LPKLVGSLLERRNQVETGHSFCWHQEHLWQRELAGAFVFDTLTTLLAPSVAVASLTVVVAAVVAVGSAFVVGFAWRHLPCLDYQRWLGRAILVQAAYLDLNFVALLFGHHCHH
jgi:hypothetical protein